MYEHMVYLRPIAFSIHRHYMCTCVSHSRAWHFYHLRGNIILNVRVNMAMSSPPKALFEDNAGGFHRASLIIYPSTFLHVPLFV